MQQSAPPATPLAEMFKAASPDAFQNYWCCHWLYTYIYIYMCRFVPWFVKGFLKKLRIRNVAFSCASFRVWRLQIAPALIDLHWVALAVRSCRHCPRITANMTSRRGGEGGYTTQLYNWIVRSDRLLFACARNRFLCCARYKWHKP